MRNIQRNGVAIHAEASERQLRAGAAGQKKAEILQKAKDTIRRRHYKEAILLLEAAREETPSSDFDDLLQFAEKKPANYEKRQKIDFVAEQAHKLNAEEKYAEAIQLLNTTLHETPDQELEVILSDIRRHVEEFNRQVQKGSLMPTGCCVRTAMPRRSDFWKRSPMLNPHNFATPWRPRDRNSSSGTPSLLPNRRSATPSPAQS